MKLQMIFSPLIWYRKERFLDMQSISEDAFNSLKPKLEKWAKDTGNSIVKTVNRRLHINVMAYNEYIEDGGGDDNSR